MSKDVNPNAMSFPEVFQKELEAIQARRLGNQAAEVANHREWTGNPTYQASNVLSPDEQAALDKVVAELRRREGEAFDEKRKKEVENAWQAELQKQKHEAYLRQIAMQNDLVGLAFSGGGIRSATFGLGVLQALSKCLVLRKVDYLSTVSGGGYLGSWLSAWIKRETPRNPEEITEINKKAFGVFNVEKQLNPSRMSQAEAQRTGLMPKQTQDEEPEPIRHLRVYSNYLSPKLGLFTSDGWSLVGIVIRNLLINHVLLVLGVVALLYAGMSVLQMHCLAVNFIQVTGSTASERSAIGDFVWRFDVILCIAFLLLAFFSIGLKFWGVLLPGKTMGEAGRMKKYKWAGLWALAIFAIAFFGSIWLPDFWMKHALQVAIAIGIGSAAIVVLVMNGNKPTERPEGYNRQLHLWTLLPLGFGAIFASLATLARLDSRVSLLPLTWDDEVLFDPVPLTWGQDGAWAFWLAAAFAAMFLVNHGIHFLIGWRFCKDELNALIRNTNLTFIEVICRWLVGCIAAGAIGGFFVFLAFYYLHNHTIHDNFLFRTAAWTVFAPPLLLLAFLLSIFTHVAVLGPALSNAAREWWSSLCGWGLFYAAAWLLLFGVGVFCVALLVESLINYQQQSLWSQLTIGGVWSVLSTLGFSYAKSDQTNGKSSSWRNLLAMLAPPLIVLGYLVMIASVAWLVYLAGWERIPGGNEDDRSVIDKRSAFHCLFALMNNYGGLQTARGICDWLNRGLDPDYTLAPTITLGLFVAFTFLAGFSAWILGRFVDANLFTLQGLYVNRLVRCYLGASRRKEDRDSLGAPAHLLQPNHDRKPNQLTGFDPFDDLPLSDLRPVAPPESLVAKDALACDGPLQLINTTLNLASGDNLAWQERKAASFTLSPFACGSPLTSFCDTEHYAGKITLGTAVGISGAAVCPNSGYHSSAAVTAMLTLFNARLGSWVGNPRWNTWKECSPRNGFTYLLREALGLTEARRKFIYLSDGGHFENLGVYELIRRRCRYIVVSDGEADGTYTFDALARLVRNVNIDFGIRIKIDHHVIRPAANGLSKQHVAIGKIYYSDVDAPHEKTDVKAQNAWEYEPDGQDRHVGLLVYIKASLTGDEPVDIEHYKLAHPSFPHETTVDQYFSESQFESYRSLGYHCANELFENALIAANLYGKVKAGQPIATRILLRTLFEHWRALPPEFLSPYIRANDTYMAIMRQLESDPVLFHFKAELAPACAPVGPHLPPLNYQHWSQRTQRTRDAEINMARQVFAMLESVFFELDIQNYRDHPVHSGWIDVCESWFRRSTTLRECWSSLKGEFSVPMQNFIDKMLERM